MLITKRVFDDDCLLSKQTAKAQKKTEKNKNNFELLTFYDRLIKFFIA